jgi:O-antigen/teichoic acid export membrane protein
MSLQGVGLGDPAGQVFYAEISGERTDHDRVLQAYIAAVRRLAIIGAVPFIVALISAPLVFSVVFGEAWTEAGEYARVLSPVYYLQFVFVPLTLVFSATQRQDLQLTWDVVRIVALLALFCAAWVFDWSAYSVVVGVGATLGFLYLGLSALCLVAITRPHEGSKEGDGPVESLRA